VSAFQRAAATIHELIVQFDRAPKSAAVIPVRRVAEMKPSLAVATARPMLFDG